MRVLVTGGAGFIGSHVVAQLAAAGHSVTALDDLSTGRRENVPPGCELIEADLRDERADAAVRRSAPEAIFHFAAQIDLRRSLADPVADAGQNIVASLRLLEAALAAGTRHFVFASSGGAIYGEADSPQDENHREAPLSPYGVAKLAVDKYLDVYRRHRGLATCSLRLSNVYGPRQQSRSEAGVVAVFAGCLSAGRPLRIHGDGAQTRDFLYVEDVARMAPLLLSHRAEGVFNLGTGVETSVTALADTMRQLAGAGAPPTEPAPAVPGEQRRSVLDAGRAARELGWKAEIPLREGLRHTLAWFGSRRQVPT
jgi:UDP-glucose 4-epimerase